MNPFRFRLSRLAKVRALQEELARAEWNAAEDLARRAESRVDELQALVDAANESLRSMQGAGTLRGCDVLTAQDLLRRTHEARAAARRQAQELRVAAEAKREPWSDLRAELKGLERLEKRARDRHRSDALREEAAVIDQTALERSARRGRPANSIET